MDNLFHFFIVLSRYGITVVFFLCVFLVGLILTDFYIMHPENPKFAVTDIIPFVIVMCMLVLLFFLVKKKERQIEERRGLNTTEHKISK